MCFIFVQVTKTSHQRLFVQWGSDGFALHEQVGKCPTTPWETCFTIPSLLAVQKKMVPSSALVEAFSALQSWYVPQHEIVFFSSSAFALGAKGVSFIQRSRSSHVRCLVWGLSCHRPTNEWLRKALNSFVTSRISHTETIRNHFLCFQCWRCGTPSEQLRQLRLLAVASGEANWSSQLRSVSRGALNFPNNVSLAESCWVWCFFVPTSVWSFFGDWALGFKGSWSFICGLMLKPGTCSKRSCSVPAGSTWSCGPRILQSLPLWSSRIFQPESQHGERSPCCGKTRRALN